MYSVNKTLLIFLLVKKIEMVVWPGYDFEIQYYFHFFGFLALSEVQGKEIVVVCLKVLP